MMNPAVEARFMLAQPWALAPSTLQALAHTISTPSAFTGTSAARHRPRKAPGKSVALVSVRGIILHRDSLLSAMLGTSAESIMRQVRDADDAETILMDIDSPGGSVAGVKEAAAVVAQAAKKKRVIASINALGASAAYWIASQASEVVVTPSGQVGSIGVIASHVDESRALDREGIRITNIVAGRYKAETVSDQPLGDEAKAEMQKVVDSFHLDFLAAVASGRNVSVQHVVERFGEGRLLRARQAKAVGMVDRIASFDEVLASLGVTLAAPARRAGRAESPAPAVETVAEADRDAVEVLKAKLSGNTRSSPAPRMTKDDRARWLAKQSAWIATEREKVFP